MFNQKYEISGEGEMRWTLWIGLARGRDTHTISLLQEDYINNLVERFGRKMRTLSPPRWNPARSSPRINAQRHPQSCKACAATGTEN